jgi:1-acyl-sn-glycerol-3-phosphate acyltransferase
VVIAPAVEAMPRHRVLGGAIALPDRRTYRRAVVGVGLWLGAPLLLARLLGRSGHSRPLHALERWWARGVSRHLAIQLDISGLEHLDPTEAYIVTPLHEGFADVLALLQLPLDLRFVARDELFAWRYVGGLLRDTRQVKISPEQGAASYRSLRRQAPAILGVGESLVVFPQGSILGIEIDFKPGPFALARALGRPLLPIALTGGHRVWEHPFSPRLRYGERMSLRILPPIPAAACQALDVEGLRCEVRRQLKTAALSGTMAPPRRFVPARDGYWDGYAYTIDAAFPELVADVARHRGSTTGWGS